MCLWYSSLSSPFKASTLSIEKTAELCMGKLITKSHCSFAKQALYLIYNREPKCPDLVEYTVYVKSSGYAVQLLFCKHHSCSVQADLNSAVFKSNPEPGEMLVTHFGYSFASIVHAPCIWIFPVRRTDHETDSIFWRAFPMGSPETYA